VTTRRYTHCIVCGKRKALPKLKAPKGEYKRRSSPRKSSSYVDPLVYERDPYCSRDCCEADQDLTTSDAAA
jgi:hypothetical protein